MPIEVLGETRHTCTACGGSCQGTYVRLLGDEEARLTAYAAELGVSEPVVSGRLRHDESGRCVFLGADNLCAVHKRWGYEQKPVVCRQFPLVAVRTDAAVRIGIDPGCYASRETWREAPEVPELSVLATSRPIEEDQEPLEQWFLDETEDATVASALALLTRTPTRGGLPEGFASRLVTRLQAAPLRALIEQRDTAPAMRIGLAPLWSAIPTWDAASPPPWPVLDAESDAWAVDVARRMVHLRLASSTIPAVPAVALLSLAGAVAAAWSAPEPRRFGAAVAAWSRALRAPPFVSALVPDGAALARLAGA